MLQSAFDGRSRALCLALPLALALSACASRPLLTPQPFPGARTPADTRVAIIRAITKLGWSVDSEQEGAVHARISGPDWSALVEIAYSNEVSLRYLSSEHLGYATPNGGPPVIHRGYNRRVKRLAQEIVKEVTIARIIDSPPSVAAPPPAELRPD